MFVRLQVVSNRKGEGACTRRTFASRSWRFYTSDRSQISRQNWQKAVSSSSYRHNCVDTKHATCIAGRFDRGGTGR